MATLRNKRNLAAVSGEARDQPWNSQSSNTSVPGLTEDYITQVSREIDARVTEKLSQECSWTVSRILGSLSELHEFRLSPRARTLSGAIPGTSRNDDTENREPPRHRSQNDLYDEVELCACRSNNSVAQTRKRPTTITVSRGQMFRRLPVVLRYELPKQSFKSKHVSLKICYNQN